MNTLANLRTAVRSDLNVTSSSSLFPEATIDNAINRAYQKSGALFRWPQLEDAQETTTQADQEYYDTPSTWRPNSMWRLQVDGDYYGESPDYSPMVFQDYLDWKADDANDGSTEKKWAAFGSWYFIYPTPSEADLVIAIWGQKNITELSGESDTTIFSCNMPECNEAIALEAVAILKKKGEAEKTGQMYSEEAKQILVVAFNKLRQEKAKYEKTQPFLYVEDMFARTGDKEQITGNF